MALIIYPTADYDSFVSVANATTVIASLTLYSTQWTALTDAEKEVYLRIACRDIVDHVDQDENPFADPIADCVAEAQSLMAIQDVVFGFSATDSVDETGAIKKQKVSSLEIEYYDTASSSMKTAPRIPTMAVPCLEALGYEYSPYVAGLAQTTLGRS